MAPFMYAMFGINALILIYRTLTGFFKANDKTCVEVLIIVFTIGLVNPVAVGLGFSLGVITPGSTLLFLGCYLVLMFCHLYDCKYQTALAFATSLCITFFFGIVARSIG